MAFTLIALSVELHTLPRKGRTTADAFVHSHCATTGRDSAMLSADGLHAMYKNIKVPNTEMTLNTIPVALLRVCCL